MYDRPYRFRKHFVVQKIGVGNGEKCMQMKTILEIPYRIKYVKRYIKKW
jgi:hypothetical protein